MTCAISFVAPVLARLRLILSSKDKKILGREWKTAVQSAPVHPHSEVSQSVVSMKLAARFVRTTSNKCQISWQGNDLRNLIGQSPVKPECLSLMVG